MGDYNDSFSAAPVIRMGGHAHHENDASEGCACGWNTGRPLALVSDDTQTETHVYYESCENAKEIAVASECHDEENLGRVLDVAFTLRNVCPGRRCAVGVHLVEVDENGREHARGFRSLTVPAHNAGRSRDVELPAMRFILPEDVSLASGGCRRHFVVRTTNHYLDAADTGC